MEPFHELGNADRLGHGASLLVVYFVGVLGFVAAMWMLIGRYLRAKRLLDEALREERAAARAGHARTFREGHACLQGIVEATGEGPPVTITMEQEGQNFVARNGTRHEWREVNRRVQARPFDLVLDEGQRVRVLPDEGVLLLHTLDMTESLGPTRRRRTASVVAGDRVRVLGVLSRERLADAGGGSYRDAPTGLAMRADPGDRLLVSAGPLEARHRTWTAFYGGAALALSAAAIAVHALLFGTFHTLVFRGTPVLTQVVDQRTYSTSYKGRPTLHYELELDRGDNHRFSAEIGRSDYQDIQNERRSHVVQLPALIVPSDPSVQQLGLGAEITIVRASFLAWAIFLGGAAFFLERRRRVPWYEQQVVVERGDGPLSND